MYWGPEYLMLYNESLLPMVGTRNLLFNPFAREQASGHTSAGLGLGLYTSERIVAAHGGTLSVQSSEAAGTRFTVRLPRRPQ